VSERGATRFTGIDAEGATIRPRIAFFDHPDVFEDFYPHYHVDQRRFATEWANTGSHALVALVQREIGNVTWNEFSVAPKLREARHEVVGCTVRFFRSSWFHRLLWRVFYGPRIAWRWRGAYPAYALLASYAASLSWRFIRVLLRERPDVILMQDYSSGRFDLMQLLARACGARFVAYHAGSTPEMYVGQWLRRLTLPRADVLIASSGRELEMLASRFHVSRSRLRTVLTPIDVDVFRPLERSQACAKLGLPLARRYILFVGRFDDRIKRISALIRAIAEIGQSHPDVDLILIGDGRDAADLKSMAASLASGRCHFPGWVGSKEELAAYYSAAECLVLPSMSEGFPTVIGEAMACGVPVVASDVGGVAELVVPGSTGWLVSPGNDDELRASLAAVLEHPERLQPMRAEARKAALEHVSPAAVAAQLRACLLGQGDGRSQT
jgi:glycosyltransferase involved in cell wall biosynthesis